MGDKKRLLMAATWLTAVFMALSWVALLATGPNEVTLVWPGTGVIYAALLYFGPRWWPFPVLLVVLLHLTIAPVPAAFIPWSVAGNVVGVLAGVGLVRHFFPGSLDRFDIPTGAGLLAGGTALSITSAAFGAVGMVFSDQSVPADLLSDALRWAMGDLFGIVVITPAVLIWLQHHFRGADMPVQLNSGYASTSERHLWFGLTVLVVLAAAWLGSNQPNQALAILGLPLAALIWGAVRLPPKIIATANAAIFILMAMAMSLGYTGPAPTSPVDITALAAFLCVIAGIPMTLAMGMHQSRQASARLLQRATMDTLTGMLNRSAFEHHARRTIRSNLARPMALAYIDLDRFRLINDAMSHAVGDDLIRAVAGVLRANLPPQDLVARIGGDEFAILMLDVTPELALARAEGLCEVMAEYRFRADGHVAAPTISIGLVPVSGDENEFGNLLALADTACFVAKEHGGNRVQRSTPGGQDIVRESSDTMRWALRLERALENDYFELHCQSIVPLHADPSASAQRQFEVLVRLREPGKPLVQPSQFMSSAERYALARRLDRHVLHQLLRWFERHPEQARQVGMCAINLSADSLQNDQFLDDLASRLHGSVLKPEQLCFELTETSALTDLGRAQRFIAAARALGCRFSLDDFGTGFCSFGYLRSLDVDYFKIDGSFVREIDSSPLSYAIVRSIADIGRVMRKQTIAECVENDITCQRLKDLGVDFAQGFAMGMPMDINEYFGIQRRIVASV